MRISRAVAVSGLVLAGVLGSAGAATAAEHEADAPVVSIGHIDDSIEEILQAAVEILD
ncbi:hypothetical protein [Streptomyces lushanensis]|uniref:hypothetical protein n=1 Tax=Streptomyces lushanensis TaxID=1434255 RepID=UPI001475C584|nr:hypothetical protein [Streptomyces lushanensis]